MVIPPRDTTKFGASNRSPLWPKFCQCFSGVAEVPLTECANPTDLLNEGLASVLDAARSRILAGRINDAVAAAGPKVCACLGVTRDAIRHAVVAHRLNSVNAIGALLQAGSSFGSCIPELEEILRDVRMPAL